MYRNVHVAFALPVEFRELPRALREGTPDGDRSLSIRLDVTRGGKQRVAMSVYQPRDVAANRYLRRMKSIFLIDTIGRLHAGSDVTARRQHFLTRMQT